MKTTAQLNDTIKDWKERDKAFFDEAFKDMPGLPDDLRTASERIVRAYGIRGICDPGYIANVIAVELGRGDGLSNFQ